MFTLQSAHLFFICRFVSTHLFVVVVLFGFLSTAPLIVADLPCEKLELLLLDMLDELELLRRTPPTGGLGAVKRGAFENIPFPVQRLRLKASQDTIKVFNDSGA